MDVFSEKKVRYYIQYWLFHYIINTYKFIYTAKYHFIFLFIIELKETFAFKKKKETDCILKQNADFKNIKSPSS